jgi:hypothetical protein
MAYQLLILIDSTFFFCGCAVPHGKISTAYRKSVPTHIGLSVFICAPSASLVQKILMNKISDTVNPR